MNHYEPSSGLFSLPSLTEDYAAAAAASAASATQGFSRVITQPPSSSSSSSHTQPQQHISSIPPVSFSGATWEDSLLNAPSPSVASSPSSHVMHAQQHESVVTRAVQDSIGVAQAEHMYEHVSDKIVPMQQFSLSNAVAVPHQFTTTFARSGRSLPLTLATSSPLDCSGIKNDSMNTSSDSLGQHMSVPHPQALMFAQQQQHQQQQQQQSMHMERNNYYYLQGSDDNENNADIDELNRRRKRKRLVKHPVSAYVFYVAECKARLQHSRPDLTFGEIARIIGANWQKLTHEDREKYNQMACSDKLRYAREMARIEAQENDMLPKRRKRDPNAPKHPVSAYLFFVAESRTKLCKEYPAMSFGEMAKFIGSKWKALSNHEREKYSDLASKDKERYERELSTYVKPLHPEGIPVESGKRRKRSPNAPKHPVSAYLFYVAEQRKILCATDPGKSFKEMASFIGARWKQLPNIERSSYVESARRDKERYEREKATAANNLRAAEAATSAIAATDELSAMTALHAHTHLL